MCIVEVNHQAVITSLRNRVGIHQVAIYTGLCCFLCHFVKLLNSWATDYSTQGTAKCSRHTHVLKNCPTIYTAFVNLLDDGRSDSCSSSTLSSHTPSASEGRTSTDEASTSPKGSEWERHGVEEAACHDTSISANSTPAHLRRHAFAKVVLLAYTFDVIFEVGLAAAVADSFLLVATKPFWKLLLNLIKLLVTKYIVLVLFTFKCVCDRRG